MVAPNSYDELLYDGSLCLGSSPDGLATAAALLGLRLAPVECCGVLEIGCATGSNLIPLALALPDSQFLGKGLSARQIALARERAATIGLANLELRVQSLLDPDESLGIFDYVIAHGVYSWVPPAVQERLLAVCARRLAPHGVAYVSYKTHPGWQLRMPVRDMLRAHTADVQGAEQRVQQARDFLKFLAQSAVEPSGVYGSLLRKEANEGPGTFRRPREAQGHSAILNVLAPGKPGKGGDIMSFRVIAMNLDQSAANNFFKVATDYLRHSDLATFVIDSLAQAVEEIGVKVDPGDGVQNRYYHPNDGDELDGGIIVWNPKLECRVVDQPPPLEMRKTRPDVPWTKERTSLGRFLEKVFGPSEREGVITAGVCLLHEMGHAMQFLSDKPGYRELMRTNSTLLEDINVAAFENTVAIELTEKGFLEAVRWDYYATR